jgi:hypothetical protein
MQPSDSMQQGPDKVTVADMEDLLQDPDKHGPLEAIFAVAILFSRLEVAKDRLRRVGQ